MDIGVNTNRVAYWSDAFYMKDLVKNATRGNGGHRYSPYESDYTDASGWPNAEGPGHANPVSYWLLNLVDTQTGDSNPGMASAVYPSGIYHVLYEGNLDNLYITYRYDPDLDANWSFRNSGGDGVLSSISTGHAQYELTQNIASSYDRLFLNVNFSNENDEADRVRNVKIIHDDYYNTDYENEPFTPASVDLIKRMTSENGHIRVLQSIMTNDALYEAGEPNSRSSFDTSSENAFSGLTKGYQMQGASGGMSIEYACKLANQTNRDLWIPLYHDLHNKSVSSIAQEILDNLNSNLKVYIELGNEVWNGAAPYFIAFDYLLEYTQQASVSANYDVNPLDGTETTNRERVIMRLYERTVEISNIFEDIFGGRSRLNTVAAWQKLIENAVQVQLGLSAFNNYSSIDTVAIGPYVGNNFQGSSAGGDKSTSVLSAIYDQQWDVDRLYEEMRIATSSTETSPVILSRSKMGALEYLSMLSSTPEFSGIKLRAYESGQHLTIPNPFYNQSDTSAAGRYVSDLYYKAQFDASSNGGASAYSKFYAEEMERIGFESIALFTDTGFFSPQQFFGHAEYPGGDESKIKGVEAFLDSPVVTVTVPQIGYRISNNRQ